MPLVYLLSTADKYLIISDIFSHYKEIKANDKQTFIARVAAANQKTELEELQDLINRFLFLNRRVRETLGLGKARDAFDSFVAGFIRFHLQDARYELVEILPEIKC